MNPPEYPNEVRVYNLNIDRVVSYWFNTYEETAKFVKKQKQKYTDTRLWYVARPAALNCNVYCICRGNEEGY